LTITTIYFVYPDLSYFTLYVFFPSIGLSTNRKILHYCQTKVVIKTSVSSKLAVIWGLHTCHTHFDSTTSPFIYLSFPFQYPVQQVFKSFLGNDQSTLILSEQPSAILSTQRSPI